MESEQIGDHYTVRRKVELRQKWQRPIATLKNSLLMTTCNLWTHLLILWLHIFHPFSLSTNVGIYVWLFISISFLSTFLAEVFWLLCIDVNADFKLALAYTGNVDGSLFSIDQRIPCEILLDFDSSFQLNFIASKGLTSVS